MATVKMFAAMGNYCESTEVWQAATNAAEAAESLPNLIFHCNAMQYKLLINDAAKLKVLLID